MAVSQLGVAYLESQDLKSENESLRQENAELSSQLAKLNSNASKNREDTYRSERTAASEASSDDSQVDTQRSVSGSQGTKEITSKSNRSRSKSGKRDDSRTKISTQVDREISRLEKERADDALFSIDVPRSRESSKSKTEKTDKRSQTKKQSNTGKQRVKRVVVEEVDVTEPVESTGEVTNNTRKSATAEQDTLLSFVDVSQRPHAGPCLDNTDRTCRNVRSLSYVRHWRKNGWHASDATRTHPETKHLMTPKTPLVPAFQSQRHRKSRLSKNPSRSPRDRLPPWVT